MMEISAVAESFFKAHLPSKVTSTLEWSSLRIEDSVRRTPQKKPSCTDITYICQIRNEDCPVYLHVEQERNVDLSIVERIMQYNLGLFIKHRKQKKDKLPIIANFVLYNGSSRNYPYHENPYDYFGVPWIARLLMGNFFGLINLNKVTDWALFHQGLSGVMGLLLKKADDIYFAWSGGKKKDHL